MVSFVQLVCTVLSLLTLLVVRLCFVLPCVTNNLERRSTKAYKDKQLMVLLGSGGHTGEMFRLLNTVRDITDVRGICWVTSSGDTTSLIHLKRFIEKTNLTKNDIKELCRARKVGEGFTSSVVSTVKSLFHTVNELVLASKQRPDLLILNGPGTSVPLCYIFTITNILGVTRTKILYVESLARVQDLSLSGKLNYLLAHRFLVQWPQLAKKYNRAEYHGILV